MVYLSYSNKGGITMPIYSRNRTGYMEAAQIPADTSYGVNDFGRILCEIQQNDIAFFEAILHADFNEVKGLNEGTILESEVAALNEASKNQLIQKIKEKAKEIITKLKGIIKNAIDNIANYTATKYAEIVNTFAKIPEEKINNWNGKITIRTFDCKNPVFNGIDISNEVDDMLSTASSAEICGRCLNKNIYGNTDNTMSSSEYVKLALEKCSSEKIFDKSNIKELKNSLIHGKGYILALKLFEKTTINKLNSTLEIAKTEITEGDEINSLVNLSNALSTYVTCLTKGAIAAVRNDMKSRATGMIKVMASINKTPKELKEAYILEAAEDFDEIMNGEFNQGLIDDEARTSIENLLKATEE